MRDVLINKLIKFFDEHHSNLKTVLKNLEADYEYFAIYNSEKNIQRDKEDFSEFLEFQHKNHTHILGLHENNLNSKEELIKKIEHEGYKVIYNKN